MKRQQMGGGRPGPYDKKDRGGSRGNMGGGGGRNGRGEFFVVYVYKRVVGYS